MMTADGYGNAGSYFNNNNNHATAYYLSLYNASPGKRPTSVYSVVRRDGLSLSTTERADTTGGAVIGRQGPRMVAFPLHEHWGYDTPNT